MNRRNLLKLAVLSPTAGLGTTVAEIRQSIVIDGNIPLQIIVSVQLGWKSAEKYRQAWNIGGPFEHEGEWSLISAEKVNLPDDLARMPGSLMKYEAVVGEAAAHQLHLTGSFRRDNVAYIVRMQDGQANMLIRIARFFGAQALPSLLEASWSDQHLKALLPNEADLGLPMEEQDLFWP